MTKLCCFKRPLLLYEEWLRESIDKKAVADAHEKDKSGLAKSLIVIVEKDSGWV